MSLGMAFNKLTVFKAFHVHGKYPRKVVWLDRQVLTNTYLQVIYLVGLSHILAFLCCSSDTLVFHNIDHLMLEPYFTAAFMQECQLRGMSIVSAG